jgi:nucleoside-diphosphate-sugar epimerase
MPTALVTGCAGFIGSHLVERLLESDFRVIGIDCFTDYYSPALKRANIERAAAQREFTLIEKDIVEMRSFPAVDYVFHMAAQPGVRASWGTNFEVYLRNNVRATQNLLEYYKSQQIKKFIYSSSSSVYGDAPLPMREDSLVKPVSPYGVTKLAAEHLCYLYWKNFNVPSISLRYFTVYGPRQRPDMAIHKFVKAVLTDEVISIYGDGSQTRDFTFIRDVIDALVLGAETELCGEVFNVGGGSQISVNELVEEIERITEKRAVIDRTVAQKGDVKDTRADISKVRNQLGWRPHWHIRDGLKEYVRWRHEVQHSH